MGARVGAGAGLLVVGEGTMVVGDEGGAIVAEEGSIFDLDEK